MDKSNPQIRGRYGVTRKAGRVSTVYDNKFLTYLGYTTGYLTSGYSGYGSSGYWLYSVPWSEENITIWESAFLKEESWEVSKESILSREMVSFTQVDLLNYEENQIQELIFRIKTSPSISCKELANRLLVLFNDAKEEEASIAIDSLRDFHSFFRLYTNLKCPTISLTPEYNIYASWKADQNRVFSVHFLSNGDIRYVILKPNDRHPERQIRVSGTTTIDILQETVASYGVWDWITVSGTPVIDVLQEAIVSHGVWDLISVSGTVTVDVLQETVPSHGTFDWISE